MEGGREKSTVADGVRVRRRKVGSCKRVEYEP